MPRNKTKEKRLNRKRREAFIQIRDAFGEKYSWLGATAARELLLSASSWHIERYSDPGLRYRTHVMLAWERGWVKSTLLRKMGKIMGDELCSRVGKVTDAALRGSTSGGEFNPPKVAQTPILISTEFGQTEFTEDLLNDFLALTEEGYMNVALNKVASMSETQRRSIENKYSGITFKENNDFDLETDFVCWGGTYDPSQLQDDALRSRFNIVTPPKPLSSELTRAMDNSPPVLNMIDENVVKFVREELQKEREVQTDFMLPDKIYEEYRIIPRESRDIQSYLASRNWWGLEVTPEIAADYTDRMKSSRKKAMMGDKDMILDLVFDNPMSYEEIQSSTGLNTKEIYKILQSLNASKYETNEGDTKWIVHSGDNSLQEDNNTEKTLGQMIGGDD